MQVDGPYRVRGLVQSGQDLRIRAWSDTAQLRIRIRCFVRPPEPPAFKHCPECGDFNVQNGEEVSFHVSKSTFGNRKGFVNIDITDAAGHVVAETIPVEAD